MELKNHSMYMKMAIDLAKKGLGKVSPNPMVGCIIVKNNQIIGEGYHHEFGKIHAEIDALNNCIESPHDADLYVNLEPCSIYGKTSPCVEKIIKEGISEVYVGVRDLNPEINGKGIEELEKFSIKVYTDILYEECYELNKCFFKWIETAKPWVIGKVAQTKDGFMGADANSSIWITGKKSKEHTHKLRSEVDGVLIGTTTARVDNPSLTVRNIKGNNPTRIIIDTYRKLPLSLKLFNDNKADNIILCNEDNFEQSKTDYGLYLPVAIKDDLLDIVISIGSPQR